MQARHSLNPDLLKKNAAGGTHRRVGLTRRADFGAVMNSYGQATADEAVWFAEGDADRVRDLLAGVHFIGKRRASGFGEVAAWSVEPDELDGVVGHFGEPLRPVPVEMFEQT